MKRRKRRADPSVRNDRMRRRRKEIMAETNLLVRNYIVLIKIIALDRVPRRI